jgi:hypothetical protein
MQTADSSFTIPLTTFQIIRCSLTMCDLRLDFLDLSNVETSRLFEHFVNSNRVLNIGEVDCSFKEMVSSIADSRKQLVLKLDVNIHSWLPANVFEPVRPSEPNFSFIKRKKLYCFQLADQVVPNKLVFVKLILSQILKTSFLLPSFTYIQSIKQAILSLIGTMSAQLFNHRVL